MLQLVLSFDTEDYVTPEALDAEKFWADELTTRGMRGSFQCVAEVIRVLRRKGREDVIEALARHEIGYHTDRHSAPPVPPTALEGVGLAEGIEWVLRRQAAGWALVMETFRRVPISFCPPGDSWTPHVLLAMAAAGVKVWCASVPAKNLNPAWYCGLLSLNYDFAFDSFMGEEAAEEERFKRTFEETACAESAGRRDGGLYPSVPAGDDAVLGPPALPGRVSAAGAARPASPGRAYPGPERAVPAAARLDSRKARRGVCRLCHGLFGPIGAPARPAMPARRKQAEARRSGKAAAAGTGRRLPRTFRF